MMADGPLLTARQGREGPFVKWLEDLGLSEFLRQYPLVQLVDWGWLVPQYRVIFPVEFFEGWQDYPYHLSEHEAHFKEFALLWDSEWRINGDNEPLWFLDSLFQQGNTAGNLLRRGLSPNDLLPAAPDAFLHQNGQTIIPYADYFFHWQGYALIDVICASDCIAPLLNTPDVEIRAKNLGKIARTVRDWNPQEVLTIPSRWGGLATPMTWLSHYRAFRDALSAHEMLHNQKNDLRRPGAKLLASHLGIDTTLLGNAIKGQLLVLAQNWRRSRGRHRLWIDPAWPYLQRDIAIAMEWLCYLSDKTLDFYLDLWQYPHLGQMEWAELHEVLPHEFFTDRQRFLLLAPSYLKTYNGLVPEAKQWSGDNLKNLIDRLRGNNYPFSSFLGAFRQLHDELTYRLDRKGSLDFRELRPLDYYLLLALRVEICLQYAMKEDGTLPAKLDLNAYIQQRARCCGVSDKAVDHFKRSVPRYTYMHKSPDDPIGPIMSLERGSLSEREHYLVQAFLCCSLARNYFAHHYYHDHKLLRSEKSGFMLSSILVTVLVLLDGA